MKLFKILWDKKEYALSHGMNIFLGYEDQFTLNWYSKLNPFLKFRKFKKGTKFVDFADLEYLFDRNMKKQF